MITPSTATRAGFPWVLASGVVFGAILLGQICAAQIGYFGRTGSILLIAAGLLLVTVAAGSLLWTWLKTPPSSSDKAPLRKTIVGVVCALAAVAASVIYVQRWVRPTENIMGGYDEAIYAITAANLAQTGHYRLNAALLPTLPDEVKPWILARLPRMGIRTEKTPPRYLSYQACLFIEDEQKGILVSQFPVGFPALLGSAEEVFGFNGQRFINPLLLFTAACVAGSLVTSWLGILPGMAAFVLWLWFPLQVWAGNTRYAEVLLQLLWLLTLLGLSHRVSHALGSGVLAGLALGVSLAVKIDALPVLIVATITIVATTFRHERMFFRSFGLALVVSAAIAAMAVWQDNRAYMVDTLRSITESNRSPLFYGAAISATAALIWASMLCYRRSIHVRESWLKWQPWITGAMFAGGFGLAAFAYFVRSHPAVFDSFYYWPYGREIRSYREETFLRLGWYWQPWGLALAILGIGVALRSIKTVWQGLAVGIGLLFLIGFAYDIKNNPLQPYAMRRFSPYAIPLMILGAAAAAQWLPSTWARTRSWLTAAVAAGLLAGFWPINERLNGKIEYEGLMSQVGLLAEKIPDGAVVLVSGNEPLTRLASCLEFVYQKPCLIVRRQARPNENMSALRRACELWGKEGRPIFVLSANAGETFKMPGVTADPIDQGIVKTSAIQASEKNLVTKQTSLDMPYSLNELRLSAPFAPPTPPYNSP